MTLVVAPCSAAAATHAVMSWHYSKRMPIGKVVRFGAWEDDRYIGAVLFARGAAPQLGTPYGLDMTEVVELVRVALRDHRSPVTEIVARSMRMLRAQSPGLRLVVSFADPAQGHVGRIYHAGNWIYCGQSAPAMEWLFRGKWRHNRDVGAPGFVAKRGDGAGLWQLSKDQRNALPKRVSPGKHRYLYPLDRAMRRQVERLALPYPQPTRGPDLEGEMPASQAGWPGSIPGDRSTVETEPVSESL